MGNSKSIWQTWNAVTGCTKYSDGCKNCYALSMALKFQKMGVQKYLNGFKITYHENALSFPSKLKKSSFIFANSMTDLFHEDIDFGFLQKIFKVMNDNPQHIFFVLTKRADRMAELCKRLIISDNIWLGVTIESSKYINRLDYLKQIKCKYKYIVTEPLLSEIPKLDLEGINWITGGEESGPNARKCDIKWIESIIYQCEKNNIPFSFKYRGTKDKIKNSSQYYNHIPSVLRDFQKNSLENGSKNLNQLKLDF